MKTQNLHAITWKENNLFVAKFLELELVSQGKTKQEALANLKEAFEHYLEGEDTKNQGKEASGQAMLDLG